MSQLKKCRKCDVELVVGENIIPSRFNNYDYECKSCKLQYNKKWEIKNPEKRKKGYRKSDKKRRESEGRGVYLVKYRWINFYIGEGWLNDRKSKHLKWKFSKGNQSLVAELVDERNLSRKYLSFHVLEYLDDKPTMLKRERHYRRELKPYINPLD